MVTTPDSFYLKTTHRFQEAVSRAGGVVERWYRIGNGVVRVHFAGVSLAPRLTPALEHLRLPQDAQAFSLTIYAWDSASTSTAPLSPAWPLDAYNARGEVAGFNTHRFRTAFDMGAGVLSLLDTQERVAFYWAQAAQEIPYYESGAPFRTLLHWWMKEQHCQITHAAAVGAETGGVLLVGKGGMGKSTSALACLTGPLAYAGDDYVLVTATPRPRVFSLYNSVKLEGDHLQRFPELHAAISNPDRRSDEKALVFLNTLYPHKMCAGFPLRALLVPRVTGRRETTVQRISAAAGLAALAPSTIFQLPGAGREAFTLMAQIAQQIPAFALNLGTDIQRIPEAILAVLQRLDTP
ncbi:MAG: serine kinase [Anaerolineae bacterium]|nr:serine kinase [Anaerolineae bacterium]